MTTRLRAAGREIARFLCDAAAFLVPAVAYVAAVSHEPASWDTAELQGVPYMLGISHPTGFPAYVLLGWLWSHVLPLGSIAFRMNAMCAVAVAATVALAYAVALELGAPRVVALPSALWLAFTHTVFSHAIRAEAQDLSFLLSALAIYAMLRWMRTNGPGWYAAAFLLYGTALAAHPNAIWILPGFVLASFVARNRPSLRLALGSAGLIVAGLLLYLYVPVRSWWIQSHGLDPTAALRDIGSAGPAAAIFWNYNAPTTWPGLLRELTGSESGTPGAFLSSFNPAHWQDALWALINGAHDQFGAFALVLAAVGLIFAWRRDWRTACVLLVCCSLALLFAVTYNDEGDIDRYRMLALWMVAPLMAQAAPRIDDIASGVARVLLGAFLFAGAWFAWAGNDAAYRHAPREGGRWVIDAVGANVPAGGVVIAGWVDATSLAYGAYADESLPGRIIVSGFWPDRVPIYRSWVTPERPVFLLIDPHDLPTAPDGMSYYRRLDDYHVLYQALP